MKQPARFSLRRKDQNKSAGPAIGTPVPTACGGLITLTPDTPTVEFKGERIYFCLAACKADYESNPNTSCLAGRLAQSD